MISPDDCRSFEEFWPVYVKAHQKRATRIAHFVGTSGAMACIAGGLLTKRRWLLALAPIVGYGPAWAAHFFVEGNTPTTVQYPLWSLRADLVMWSKMMRFQMTEEVERVLREEPARTNAATEPVSDTAN